jgi:hypothetical protein
MAGVPLPLGLEGCYPCRERVHLFCLWLNHRSQVDDQVLDDTRGLFPPGGIQQQALR